MLSTSPAGKFILVFFAASIDVRKMLQGRRHFLASPAATSVVAVAIDGGDNLELALHKFLQPLVTGQASADLSSLGDEVVFCRDYTRMDGPLVELLLPDAKLLQIEMPRFWMFGDPSTAESKDLTLCCCLVLDAETEKQVAELRAFQVIRDANAVVDGAVAEILLGDTPAGAPPMTAEWARPIPCGPDVVDARFLSTSNEDQFAIAYEVGRVMVYPGVKPPRDYMLTTRGFDSTEAAEAFLQGLEFANDAFVTGNLHPEDPTLVLIFDEDNKVHSLQELLAQEEAESVTEIAKGLAAMKQPLKLEISYDDGMKEWFDPTEPLIGDKVYGIRLTRPGGAPVEARFPFSPACIWQAAQSEGSVEG